MTHPDTPINELNFNQSTAQVRFGPPMRKFKVIYAKAQRYRVGDQVVDRPYEQIIEREQIAFYDSFVVFGNGGEYPVKTNLLVLSWESGMRIEEITDEGT